MDKNQRFIYLFERFAAKKYSVAEKEELFSMVSSADYDSILQQLVGDQWNQTIPEWVRENDDQKAADVFEQIMTRVKVKKLTPDNEAPQTIEIIGRRKFWRNIAAAAAVIVLGTSTYFMYFNETDNHTIVATTPAQQYKNDVAPGGNKAILALADGSQIILDSAANGALSQQGTTKIIKLDDGQLAYTATGAKDAVMYNTITTPKGGQYQVVLSDGSKVWLNAASSLRFPTAFPGAERKVELTGEGYFEVEENPTKPFIVSSLPSVTGGRGVEVKVLGTHFNINSYDDELSIKVSLIKGSVQVAKLNNENVTNPAVKEIDTKILRPGEQAELSEARPLRVNDNVDMDDVLAWKNGYLSFNNADLQSVMRQLARWYDVDVLYEGALPKRKFEGKMPRNSNLSEVLKVIETNNVHMKIQGKKIVVNP